MRKEMNKWMRQKWIDAGYRHDCGSAEVVPPPPSDFLRVYYLTTAEHAISNISLHRLKIARFSELNDPFEVLALNFRDQEVADLSQDFKEFCDGMSGVICFSADWTNPVLWSHYGQGHRGVCLGVNIRRSHTYEVEYLDERIVIDRDAEGRFDLTVELGNKLLATKFAHWRYENERRIFVNLKVAKKEGSLYFTSFNDEIELAEVILGSRCAHSVWSVRSLVRKLYKNVTTYGARPADKWFTVVPDEERVPNVEEPRA